MDNNTLINKRKELQELFEIYSRREKEENNHLVVGPDGSITLPSPWCREIESHPQLQKLMGRINSIDPSHLLPMTDRMKELSDEVGLPLYDGKAETNLQKKIKSSYSERCPICGDKIRPIEVIRFKRGDIRILPRKLSGVMKCGGCGMERHPQNTLKPV